MTAKDSRTSKTDKTAAGGTELNEEQLTDVSGGPHYTTFDGIVEPATDLEQKVRLPVGSVRANKG